MFTRVRQLVLLGVPAVVTLDATARYVSSSDDDIIKLNKFKLVNAQVFFRHGANLGKVLKKRYVEELHFISDEYNPDQIYVRSTDFTRTVASAQNVLEGLFGNSARHADICVLPRGEETFTLLWKKCPAVQEFHKQALDRLAELQRLDPVFQRLAVKVGVLPHELQVVHLLDLITARIAHEKDLPEHLEVEDHHVIHQTAVGFLKDAIASTEESLSLIAGPLFKLINDGIDEAISKGRKKLCLYSVHDTTLVPILLALNIFDNKWPGFSAAITIELYEKSTTERYLQSTNNAETDNYYVRVLYNNETQILPECGVVMCPLSEFRKITARYTPADWDAACRMKVPAAKKPIAPAQAE